VLGLWSAYDIGNYQTLPSIYQRPRAYIGEAELQRTANGFNVFKGSTAVLVERPSAEIYFYVVAQRKQLIADGTLIDQDGFLVFTKDAKFSSCE